MALSAIPGNPTKAGTLAAIVLVELENGDMENITSYLKEGFHSALHANEPFMMLYILASAATYYAQLGQLEKALEIYALVDSWEFAANSKWFIDVYQKPLLELTKTDSIITPNERQPKDVLWEMAESILAELGQ